MTICSAGSVDRAGAQEADDEKDRDKPGRPTQKSFMGRLMIGNRDATEKGTRGGGETGEPGGVEKRKKKGSGGGSDDGSEDDDSHDRTPSGTHDGERSPGADTSNDSPDDADVLLSPDQISPADSDIESGTSPDEQQLSSGKEPTDGSPFPHAAIEDLHNQAVEQMKSGGSFVEHVPIGQVLSARSHEESDNDRSKRGHVHQESNSNRSTNDHVPEESMSDRSKIDHVPEESESNGSTGDHLPEKSQSKGSTNDHVPEKSESDRSMGDQVHEEDKSKRSTNNHKPEESKSKGL